MQLVQRLLDEYAWFLSVTDGDKSHVIEHFSIGENYDEGRDRGRRFGDTMGELTKLMSTGTKMHRYLLI